MIRLFWMTAAFGVAAYGVSLWTTADPTLSYMLRDGLLLAGLGFLLALWTGGENQPAHASAAPAVRKTLTSTGHLFFWTGVSCVLAALLLQIALLGDSMSVLTYGWALPAGGFPVVAITTGLLWQLGRLLLLFTLFFPRFWASRRYSAADATSTTQTAATNWISILLLLFVGLGTHLLVYSQLPAVCTGQLCEVALAVSEGLRIEQAGSVLPLGLARFFYLVTAESLLSIRLATIVLSLAALVFCYLLARQLVSNGSALLGALIVAFTPWYHTLDATALAALVFFFWATLGLWGMLHAWRQQEPRWALLGGLALGLASMTPVVQLALLGWLLLWSLLALLPPRRAAQATLTRNDSRFLAGSICIGFLLAATPQFLQQSGLTTLQMAPLTFVPFEQFAWLSALFQHGQLSATQWAGVPPLTVLLGATTIVGMGTLLGSTFTARSGRVWGWLLSGLLIALLLFNYIGNGPDWAESATVLFLFCVIITLFAVARWLALATATWHTLTAPSTVMATVTILVAALSVGPLWQLANAGQTVRSNTQAAAEQAMLTEIAALWAETPDAQIFAPASVRENPAARLYLGDAQLAQLQPLYTLLNAFYTTDEIHPVTYVVPNEAQSYLDLIQRLQPGIAALPAAGAMAGELPYTVLSISRESQLARQGLLGVAWESAADGSSTSQLLAALGPLQLEPSTVPELRAPFTLQWTGALRVAIPGTYRITLDQAEWRTAMPASESAGLPTLSMQLDNRLILDTLLGVEDQELFLAKGFYQLTLLYRQPIPSESEAVASVAPQAFAIGWQRPDGQTELIPRNVLYNLSLPNVGLLGEYVREGGAAADTSVDIRKDLVVGLVASRAEPYRVQWRGQVAAIRPGEYLFAGLSAPDSATQLLIDGVLLFDTTRIDGARIDGAEGGETTAQPSSQPTDTSAYAEGTIYLERGWHEIQVDYEPAAGTNGGTAPLQLYWQPPGSGPTLLASEYLAPSLTPLSEADRSLPLGPQLLPEAIGSDTSSDGNSNAFALAYGTAYWEPQTVHPPVGLPVLPMEMQWQVGSCGTAPTQLNQPHGVALSVVRRLLYVADSANQQVVEYSWDGEVNQIYTHGDWQEPVDIALIDEGFPVVLDAVTQGLYNLNPVTGAVEQRAVGSGFYYPRGLSVDALGNLLVADTGGARIVRLQPNGEPNYTFGGPETAFGRGQPTDLIDLNGVIWAVTAENGRLWQPERGGSLNAIEPTNTIHGPHLATVSNAAFLLSDPAQRRVLYLAPNGEPLAQMIQPGLIQPTGIAAAIHDELLYLAVVDTSNCQLSFFRTNSWPIP